MNTAIRRRSAPKFTVSKKWAEVEQFWKKCAKVEKRPFLQPKNGYRDLAASGGDRRRSDMIIQAVEPPAGICGRDP